MQKRQLTPSSGSLSTKSSKTRCGILPDAELRYVRNFAGAEFGKKVNLTALLRTTKPLLNGEKRLFSCEIWYSTLPRWQVGPAAHCPCNTLVQQHAFSCKGGAVEDVALLDLVDKPSAECLLVNANTHGCIGFLAKVSGQVNDGAASG